ncbi:Neuralized-like protein 4 [Homalodisca vitripennis]|nr:Neuralized-like protein 4 [Homalodisca vitripennis]
MKRMEDSSEKSPPDGDVLSEYCINEVDWFQLHEIKGRNVQLSSGRLTAKRVGSYNQGVVLTSREILKGQLFQVRIDAINSNWVSSLCIGVTSHPIATFSLPVTALGLKRDSWIICSDFVFHNGQKVGLGLYVSMVRPVVMFGADFGGQDGGSWSGWHPKNGLLCCHWGFSKGTALDCCLNLIPQHVIQAMVRRSGLLSSAGGTLVGLGLSAHDLFQAEVAAIMEYASENFRLWNRNSQAALMVLDSCVFNSKLVLGCYKVVSSLARFNNVTVCWVPGHEGILGIKWDVV